MGTPRSTSCQCYVGNRLQFNTATLPPSCAMVPFVAMVASFVIEVVQGWYPTIWMTNKLLRKASYYAQCKH